MRIELPDNDSIKNATTEEKLEVAVYALKEAMKLFVFLLQRQDAFIDRQECMPKAMARVLSEEDRARWERVLLEAIESKSTGESSGKQSELGKPYATKRMA